MLVYQIIQYILLGLLGLATGYILLFAVAGLFYRPKKYKPAERYGKIAVLIPGYREDDVIVDSAMSALQQQYPLSKFDVVVIADSFSENTLAKLRKLPVKLLEVEFEKSTKSKALNKAMQTLKGYYDIAVVLDADNIMAPDFLQQINTAFENGYTCVQGHRTAKNQNNRWAMLDSVSEEINNHIFRKGHRVLGLSSAIIGSGMAFRYSYFKSVMTTVHAVGGFDKELELKMLKAGIEIEYLDNAYVYDEKIQESEVFSTQRRRWLSAQFHYLRYGFADAVRDLFRNGNLDYFDKALQFVQPPRVLLLAAVLVLGCIFIPANAWLEIPSGLLYGWAALIIACVTAILISIPRSLIRRETLLATTALPAGVALTLLSLLKIKGANKTFLHTKHTTTTR